MTDIAQGPTTDVDESPPPCARGHVPGASSMWFFVIGDLLIFGVYFVGYMYFRGQNRGLFLADQAQLNLDIGAINTVVLLTSSLFVALGVAAARAGERTEALRRFWIALAFGAAFPLLKMFEWIPEIKQGSDAGQRPVLHVLLRDDRHAPVPCHPRSGHPGFHHPQPESGCRRRGSRSSRQAPPTGTWSTFYGWSCSPCST